jgi:hypothetical protein
LCVLAGAHAPAVAQKTTFNPSIQVDQYYTDNADVGTEDEAESDSVTHVEVDLPVSREWRRGSWFFTYNPGFEKYSDNDDLDHDTHELRFNLTTAPSRTSSFGLDASASRTQYDPRPGLIEDTDVFLTRRTNRDLYAAVVRYGRSELAGGRWSWTADAGAFRAEYDAISGFDADEDVPAPQDRTSYGAGFGVDREVSRRTAIGGRLEVDHFELDDSGEFGESESETAYAGSFTFRRTLSTKSSLHASAGAYATSSDDSDDPDVEVEDDDGGDVGLQATVGYSREFRRVSMSLSGAHRPTAGGALQGTSTDTAVAFGLSGLVLRKWNWSWSLRGAHRDPRDDDETVTSLTTGAGFERFFARVLSFTMRADYATQEVDDVEDDGAVSVVRGSIGLVYYPLGRTQIAGN